MRRLTSAAVTVIAALLTSSQALAQELPPRDVNAGVGLVFGTGLDPDRAESWDGPNGAFHLDLGRYWSTHLKSDFGVTFMPERHVYDFPRFPIDPFVPFAPTETTRRLTGFSGAMTYQFFENDFVHPYVSGGVQAGYVRDHVSRPQQVLTINRVRTAVPAIDEEHTSVLVRPFVAAGCKSYFNSHTFVRSELAVAVSGRGFSHATLRIGLGVDF